MISRVGSSPGAWGFLFVVSLGNCLSPLCCDARSHRPCARSLCPSACLPECVLHSFFAAGNPLRHTNAAAGRCYCCSCCCHGGFHHVAGHRGAGHRPLAPPRRLPALARLQEPASLQAALGGPLLAVDFAPRHATPCKNNPTQFFNACPRVMAVDDFRMSLPNCFAHRILPCRYLCL